ncbi:lysophosphatidic acid receptor 6-like [Astatotilapia calliptera]|uniref:G-protein coupled receptors family 1 profile domain-containing protein n=1 Tax=Astatotilapia calliptera TaxID=8154 RepID=A0A3P8PLC3_ASTCA|nr:lysophosphatidic acid receptor 6-like [Astatotilapia calliptera]
MNTSNSSTEDDRVYAGIFGCIMVIGLPLNAVSLWILLRRHSLKSPNAVFMVNLALTDLLAIMSLPMRIYHHATGTPLGIITCLFSVIIFRKNLRSSASFITFISVDRLLAVVYPLRSRHLRTSCNAWKGAALVWGFFLVVNIPEGIGFFKHLQNHTEHICFQSHYYKSVTRSAIIYLQIVLLVTMLAVNIVCTVMVSWTLHKHLSDSAKVRNKVNVMLIFAINLLIFCTCFLPMPLHAVTKSKTSITPLACLTVLNCCLDPLTYYFSFDSFWKKKEDTGREL